MSYPDAPDKQARDQEQNAYERDQCIERTVTAFTTDNVGERQVIEAGERDDEGEESLDPCLINTQRILRHFTTAVGEDVGDLKALHGPEADRCRENEYPGKNEHPANTHQYEGQDLEQCPIDLDMYRSPDEHNNAEYESSDTSELEARSENLYDGIARTDE